MLLNYLPLLKEIGFVDLLDILFSSCIVWLGFTVIQTRRTRNIGSGLVIYGLILLLANELKFNLTLAVLQALSAVVILVVVVIYQQEIRRLLEEVSHLLFRRKQSHMNGQKSVPELLVTVAYELSALRWGALIVIPGQIKLENLITEGFKLDGLVSRPLLMSIFDPSSVGHDGAMVLRGDRVELFGSRLPLTEHDDLLQQRGTRHAAAIGLAEKSDALVLVVSEESGNISLAKDGRLKIITDSQMLLSELDHFGADLVSLTGGEKRRHSYLRMTLRMIISLIITAFFWGVLVPGSAVVTTAFEVPIEVQNIPEGFEFSSVTPATAEVSLTGERRELIKLRGDNLLISLDGTLTALGRQTYPLNSSQIMLPANLEIARMSPSSVKVLVNKVPVAE